jgi:phage terminase large subunit-like protein
MPRVAGWAPTCGSGAGDGRTPPASRCELFEQSAAVGDDDMLDPETYVFIYTADADGDWTSPDVWAKSNPNLDISLKREFLESECKRALQSPRLENDFVPAFTPQECANYFSHAGYG